MDWEKIAQAGAAANSGLNILETSVNWLKPVRTKRNESQLNQQNALMQQAFDFNEQAARNQMEREMHMNSPSRKRAALEAAGMNPMLAVEGAGMGAAMGGISGAAQADSPSGKGAVQAAQAQARSQSLMAMGQIQLMQAQGAQARAAADLSNAEAEKIRTSTPHEIEHTQSLIEGQKIRNMIESATSKWQIYQAEEELRKTVNETWKSRIEGLKTIEETSKINQEILNLIAEIELKKSQKEVNEATIEKYKNDILIEIAKLNLENMKWDDREHVEEISMLGLKMGFRKTDGANIRNLRKNDASEILKHFEIKPIEE